MQEAKFRNLFLLIIISVFSTNAVWGVNIELLGKVELLPESKLISFIWDFCVTEDGLFMIPDPQAGDIKIYERNGTVLRFVKTVGRKGFRRDELGEPTYCFYDENRFGVFDFVKRKVVIYDRVGRVDFERVKDVDCPRAGYDFQLAGDKLFISGYKADRNEKPFDLYYVNIANEETTFLLPSYYKYGLNTLEEYTNEYRNKLDIKALGIFGYFDIQGNDAFFVWQGKLKIIKVDIESGRLTYFGRKTSHYIEPYASERLLNGHRQRDSDITRSERARMSFIIDIFASSDYVLVIYQGPIQKERESNFWLQFYTLNGSFIKEVPIPGKPDRRMWFDKAHNTLYSLSSELDKDQRNEKYFILEYKIAK